MSNLFRDFLKVFSPEKKYLADIVIFEHAHPVVDFPTILSVKFWTNLERLALTATLLVRRGGVIIYYSKAPIRRNSI